LSAHVTLPKNFSWLEQRKVAGSARPETESELAALKSEGITAIVSLTGTPLNPETVRKFGFDYLHAHISGAPSADELRHIVEFIQQQTNKTRAVLVHCGEGKRRTGTVLAAYLVYHGLSADEAVQSIRVTRPESIETPEQENSIREFEAALRNR
jgi:atypical dual specificity phosphatase